MPVSSVEHAVVRKQSGSHQLRCRTLLGVMFTEKYVYTSASGVDLVHSVSAVGLVPKLMPVADMACRGCKCKPASYQHAEAISAITDCFCCAGVEGTVSHLKKFFAEHKEFELDTSKL